MYTVTVKRNFTAQHYLIGGDWGEENEWHSHYYQVEVQLHGPSLNRHGYLVDIVEIEGVMEELVAHYRDKTLNDLPEFAGLNPSIEHFCRIFYEKIAGRLQEETISAMTIKIWENEIAWASYTKSSP